MFTYPLSLKSHTFAPKRGLARFTILGAGVTGMTIASQLPKDSEITIVGQHLPGDPPSKEWASPWAATIWVGVHESTPREQMMQLKGFAGLWRLAQTDPDSSVRITECTELMDKGSKQDVWYQGKVPNFRFLDQSEMPEGTLYGMRYQTVVLTPQIFLPWIRTRLESQGVKFKRITVGSLSELEGMGHDILINASGFGPGKLLDVNDTNMLSVRLQSIMIPHPNYRGLWIHRGNNNYYSTAFSRMDGTVYLGGVIDYGSPDLTAYDDQRKMLFERAHKEQPAIFKSPDLNDYDIIDDHTGVYPMRARDKGGVRVEKEVIGSQKVVHAYGQHAGGYVFSFGIADEVARLASEFIYQMPQAATLVQKARL